jgi:hypothetical protein
MTSAIFASLPMRYDDMASGQNFLCIFLFPLKLIVAVYYYFIIIIIVIGGAVLSP